MSHFLINTEIELEYLSQNRYQNQSTILFHHFGKLMKVCHNLYPKDVTFLQIVITEDSSVHKITFVAQYMHILNIYWRSENRFPLDNKG